MDEMKVVEVNEEVETTQEEVATEVAKYTLTGIESIDNLIAEYYKQQDKYSEISLKDNEYKDLLLEGLTAKLTTLEATIDKELTKLASLKSTALNAKAQEAIILLNEIIAEYDVLNDILSAMFGIDENCNGIIMKLGLDGKFVLAGKTQRTATGKTNTQLNYTERYKLWELNKYKVYRTKRDGTVIYAGLCYVGTDNRIIWDSVNGQQYTAPTKFWQFVAGDNAGIHSLNYKCFTNIGTIEADKFNQLWDKLTK